METDNKTQYYSIDLSSTTVYRAVNFIGLKPIAENKKEKCIAYNNNNFSSFSLPPYCSLLGLVFIPEFSENFPLPNYVYLRPWKPERDYSNLGQAKIDVLPWVSIPTDLCKEKVEQKKTFL